MSLFHLPNRVWHPVHLITCDTTAIFCLFFQGSFFKMMWWFLFLFHVDSTCWQQANLVRMWYIKKNQAQRVESDRRHNKIDKGVTFQRNWGATYAGGGWKQMFAFIIRVYKVIWPPTVKNKSDPNLDDL